jgi:TolA-binding protein
MAKRKLTKREEDETLIDLVDAKESAQNFFEKNQMTIIGVVAGLALLIGGYFIYKFLIKDPAEKQAMHALYKAETQFAQDSFARALDNPGDGYEGFLDIISNYGSSKAGNLAQYYAGVSYLNLGKYDVAIEYLEDFSPAGKISPIMKYGAMGDAHSELGNYDKALNNYKTAAFNYNNEFLSPYYLMKYGMLSERQGNKAEAIKAYNKVKSDYPNSTQAVGIDKYIVRAS